LVTTPGGTVLAIDPWFSNPSSPDRDLASRIERVDYILVSHGHQDHVGNAVEVARRTGAKLIASADLGYVLVQQGYPREQMALGDVGGAVQAGDATVIIAPAIHSSDMTTDAAILPAGVATGFIIKVAGGPALYFTGDTDAFGDMRMLDERYGPLDVMLLPIGGRYTMDPAGAAFAAKLIKPRFVVPLHYGTVPELTGTLAQLEAALTFRTTIAIRSPGGSARF
jgi:L-ascorbate metabolism protein UlaG (beta-lactamase superfamily)